jgi:hypothetical protein
VFRAKVSGAVAMPSQQLYYSVIRASQARGTIASYLGRVCAVVYSARLYRLGLAVGMNGICGRVGLGELGTSIAIYLLPPKNISRRVGRAIYRTLDARRRNQSGRPLNTVYSNHFANFGRWN